MFNLKVKFMLAALVLSIGGVTAANAQIGAGSVLRLEIPHSFVLRDKTLVAGSYTIERVAATAMSPSLLVLRGNNASPIIFDTIRTPMNDAANETALLFNNVEGMSFLSGIRIKGETIRIEIPMTKFERDTIARNKAKMTATESSF